MTAYCAEIPGGSNGLRNYFIMLLFAISLVAIGFGVSHAITKHGEDMYRVRSCMTGDPFWQNPESGYFARICNLDDTHDGIQILAKNADGTWREVTAFIRKIGPLSKTIEEYLVDKGYINLLWK